MTAFKEYSEVRLKEPHIGHDAYGIGGEHHLPAGTVGTIVALLGGGQAFEVEFTVKRQVMEGGEAVDTEEYHHVSLRPHQIAPA